MTPSTDTFDVIVIGGGPAGENVAAKTAKAGMSTALIEDELVGGECSYWACIPSKTLLRSGSTLLAAQAVAGSGVSADVRVDAAATFEARDRAVGNYDDSGQIKWAESEGITVIRGAGRLAGAKSVVVENRKLFANNAVVLATGSVPVIPPISGLSEAKPWTSRNATGAKSVPNRLAVVGGGVVAVEMAQAFRTFGSEVTMFVRGKRLLEREESFVGSMLNDAFGLKGISVRYESHIASAQRSTDGTISLSVNDNLHIFDEVLVATGRRPNTFDIGLETVGLVPGEKIEVDDQMRALNVEEGWLYAVGDVNGRALLTHMGKYQARIAGEVIAGNSKNSINAWADHYAVPSVIFTDPQIASVGVRLADAVKAGISAKEIFVPFNSVAAASFSSNSDGKAQIVIDTDRQTIIGATFIGPDAGEMLHAASIAVAGEVPLAKLIHAVPAFPTLSEVWLRLLETAGVV